MGAVLPNVLIFCLIASFASPGFPERVHPSLSCDNDFSLTVMIDYLLPVPNQTPSVREIDGLGAYETPPLDGTLSVPELYDWHSVHNRDHPLFIFEDDTGSLRTISMGEGVQGIHRATDIVRKELDMKYLDGAVCVIAVLCASGEHSFRLILLTTM